MLHGFGRRVLPTSSGDKGDGTWTCAPPPHVLPWPQRVVIVRQYCLPGEDEEIGCMILELEKAHTVRPTHSPFNSLVWPAKKPDRTW